MISDPKLPFASDPTGVGGLKSPAETSIPIVPVQAPVQAPVLVAVSRPAPSVARLWLRRIGVLLFVFLCATLGVMLMILPWRPEWTDNHLLVNPTLLAFFSNGFTRGVCTGLGVINVWI